MSELENEVPEEFEETGDERRDAMSRAFDEAEAPEIEAPEIQATPEIETNLEIEATPEVESDVTPDTETPEVAKAEKAPASWTPAAREHWAGLPDDLKATIAKRESEIQNRLNETTQERQLANNFQELVNPFQGMFQAQGVDTFQGIHNTLQLAAQLQMGSPMQKAQAAANIIQQFGVDINTLDDLIVGNIPAAAQSNPQIEQLQAQIGQMQQFIQQQQYGQQQQFQAQQQQINQETEQFMSQNEFANDLRNEMADFMDLAQRQGQQIDLKTAYNRALASRPDIQQVVQNRQTSQNSQQALQNANRAASSIPQRGAGAVEGGTPASMRAALEQAWNDG